MDLNDNSIKNNNWCIGYSASEKILELNKKWKALILNEEDYINNKLKNICSSKVVTNSETLKVISEILEYDDIYLKKVGIDHNEFRIAQDSLKLSKFKEKLEKAIELIIDVFPWMRTILNQVIDNIIPIEIVNGTGKAGFSSVEAKGLIFLSINKIDEQSVFEVAIDLFHEIGHTILFTYQFADEIIEKESRNLLVYSSIKKSKRPVIMTFHALYALTYMKYFLKALLQIENIEVDKNRFFLKDEFSKISSMHLETYKEILEHNIKFTTLGKILFLECIHN